MLAPKLEGGGRERYEALPGLGRLARPEEIAHPVVWLTTEGSAT
jgi:hypothetical protein